MRIGIDLGGTKIEAIVLDDAGAVPFRERRPTPRDDYAATVDAIVDLVRTAERAVGRTATVGIGMPGAISPATGLVKNANSTWLIGHPLDRDLARQLGRPVRLANDANCFALSEASDGAAAGAEVVFGVIVGTGCGGGVVVGGHVLTGPNAIAGEWGHNPLPWPAPEEYPWLPCYCGKRGCLETFLSGPGLVRDYATAAGVSPRGITGADVVARAGAGDTAATAALERYAHRLARGLATVINVLDPDVIVLGGGVSNVAMLYEAVPRWLGEFVFSDRVTSRLVPPMHGDSSGVRGAAWLWPPQNTTITAPA
jgi:fructokinase